MEREWYRVEDLAELLQLHPKTVQRFIREGLLAGRKVGRAWLVHKDALKDYAHAELASPPRGEAEVREDMERGDSPRVRAVVDIAGQGAERASRLSSSILAALAAPDESRGRIDFAFAYHAPSRSATYTFTGTPTGIAAVMTIFERLEGEEEET